MFSLKIFGNQKRHSNATFKKDIVADIVVDINL